MRHSFEFTTEDNALSCFSFLTRFNNYYLHTLTKIKWFIICEYSCTTLQAELVVMLTIITIVLKINTSSIKLL